LEDQQQLEQLAALLVRELLASPELIFSLTGISRDDGDGAARSPLQIELILRSLNPSLAKLLESPLR